MKLAIYFAGSIRGATFEGKEACYWAIIDAIRERDILLSEHVAVTGISEVLSDSEIYLRDINWLANCHAVVAEVSAPSLGVGYEISVAVIFNRPILCLHKQGVRVSAMITGNPLVTLRHYDTPGEAADHVRLFMHTEKLEDCRKFYP